MTDAEKVVVLLEALKEAEEHLSWIGYGDGYERSCVPELPKKLKQAIEIGEKQ